MIKAIIFDINGTLADIYTSESDDHIYRTTANFLDYHGIRIAPDKLKYEYFDRMKKQKENSHEKFPEFDVVKLFVSLTGKDNYRNRQLAEAAATVFRAAGRYKLELYEGVMEVLNKLDERYRLAAVSDGQKLWAVPEMTTLGLSGFFDPVIISSEYGFRKPDQRIFKTVLKKLHVTPDEALYVGNDMYRDIYGAREAGLKTVFFHSNQGCQEYCGAEPDYVIRHFSQLTDAVNFLDDPEH